MSPFHTLWKHQKTFGFLVFSGGINGNIGQKWIKDHFLKGDFIFQWKGEVFFCKGVFLGGSGTCLIEGCPHAPSPY